MMQEYDTQRNTQRFSNRLLKIIVSVSLLLCFIVGSAHAELAQIPLFLTSSVDPNIMFILDDSGSMQWETMPDELTNMFNQTCCGNYMMWVYPRTNGLHGANDYGNAFRVPSFNVASIMGRAFRSAQINAMYYDPAITYRPWVNADGNQMTAADPVAAPNRPLFPGFGTRNLTDNNTQTARWVDNRTNVHVDESRTFYPAVYSTYVGPAITNLNVAIADASSAIWVNANYNLTEIRSTTPEYVGEGRVNRTDCVAAPTCTYAEEIQNFANWYSYHRNRIFSSRAGIGRAFSGFNEELRVGFATINTNTNTVDSVAGRAVTRGVRPFIDFPADHVNYPSATPRTDFYNDLYTGVIDTVGTPLRRALDGAGQYFIRADARGPWSTTPGINSGNDLVCRNSYSILMTDGYTSGGDANSAYHADRRENTDGSTAQNTTNVHPGHSAETPLNYTYAPADPYQDNRDNTLADVAMYYWKRDLRPDLANRVPISSQNSAFWQHMVTFGVGLGVSGSIDPAAAWAAAANGDPIVWPNPSFGNTNCGDGPAGTCAARIDDLLHATINSRGGFFSTSDPDTFATELANTLTSILARTESSAAAIATNSTRLVDGSLIYQARFDSNDWSGELRAYPIAIDGTVIYTPTQWATYYATNFPTLTVPTYPGWSTSDTNKIPAHGSRSIVTWNGSVGIPFTVAQWNNFNTTQQGALIDGAVDINGDPDNTAGQNRLNWIRGEDISGMRSRSVTLGDIVNSDPLVVGVPNFRYELLPTGTPGKNTYITYRQNVSTRPRMLYVGANDGMLHAFNATTGVEQFAFVPAGVYSNLAELTKPDYDHKYYVDGSLAVGDAFIPYTDHNGASQSADWRTIVVGSLGAGGRSIYALDVTDPDNFSHHNILWEFNHPDLGYTFGQPQIVRLQNGVWAAVFGNGYLKREVDTDPDFTTQLFIVDLATGTLIKKIDTGVGSTGATSLNQFVGMSTLALLPDSQRTITAAYAGDLQGNLWKFNLSGNAPGTDNHSGWTSAHVTGTTLEPLFTARNDAGQIQPITAPLEIGVPPTGQAGYMIYFGTGKYFETGDNVVGASPPIQSFYGIWDNGSRIDVSNRSDINYSLVEQEIKREITVGVENDGTLTVNNIGSGPLAANETNYRIVSEEAVNYPGKRGWSLDLVSPVFGQQGERVVSSPLLRRGRIIFTTLIPMDDPCSTGGTSWLMELDATTGARLTKSVFDVNKDGSIDSGDFVTVVIDGTTYTIPVSGRQSKVGIIKTPAVIEAGELEYKYFGGSDGDIEVVSEAGGDADDFGRRSWRQLQ